MVPGPFQWVGISGPRSFQRVGTLGMGMLGVGTPLRHGTWDTMGHGRQVSSTHPTEMISCLIWF